MVSFITNKFTVRKKLPKISFFIAFAIALFLLSYPQTGIIAQSNGDEPETEPWFVLFIQNETDYDEDELPDVITTITPINDTFLEIYVNRTAGGSYKWASAVCNITGVEDIGKWEYNPVTDIWTYTPNMIDFYGKLTNWGLPEDWCNETDNNGFALFSVSNKDKQYRLNFTEGHKVIQVHTGKGSEEKEAITSKKILELFDLFDDWWNWFRARALDSYVNGTELHIQDMNVNITLDNEVVHIEKYINHTPMTEENANARIYYIGALFHMFTCWERPFGDYFNVTLCPEDDYNDKYKEFAIEYLANGSYNSSYHNYIFPIYARNAQLTYYSLTYFTESIPVEVGYNEMRLRPNKMLTYMENKTIDELQIVNLTSYTDNCIRFVIPAFTHTKGNITMPSPINSFSLGNHPEIIIENYTVDNSFIFEIKPYPCCGMKNTSPQEIIQIAEVCM